MKPSIPVLLAVLHGSAAVSVGVPVLARHSFAVEYDIEKPVTLEGALTRVVWVNPHSWIYVDGPKDGKTVNWSVEFGSGTGRLRRDDFPPGINVVVTGHLARNGSPTINAESVKLPDGRDLFTASSNGDGDSK